jgi:hypothetical protein
VARDDCKWFEAAAIGFGSAHEDERGSTVGDGAGVCGGDRSAFAKGRLEVGDFVGSGFERELVVGDDPVNSWGPGGFAGGDGEGDNFGGKTTFGGGFLRAREGCEREFVLRLP